MYSTNSFINSGNNRIYKVFKKSELFGVARSDRHPTTKRTRPLTAPEGCLLNKFNIA